MNRFTAALVATALAANINSWTYNSLAGGLCTAGSQKDCGQAGWQHVNSFCDDVGTQTPIDIQTASAQTFGEQLTITQGGANCNVNLQADGHTWKMDGSGCADKPTATFKGKTYKLLQWHFHAPSEHAINGKRTEMEHHYVFQLPSATTAGTYDDLLVVGALIQEGANNAFYDKFFSSFPAYTNAQNPTKNYAKVAHSATVSLVGDLPAQLPEFYHYNGSLTTPPCSPTVTWIVLKSPITASRTQINAFRDARKDAPTAYQQASDCTDLNAATLPTGFDTSKRCTSRTLQPLGTRKVYISKPVLQLSSSVRMGIAATFALALFFI